MRQKGITNFRICSFTGKILFYALILANFCSGALAQNSLHDEDIDNFMKKVLVRWEENWPLLRNFIFIETEETEVWNLDNNTQMGSRIIEYHWFERNEEMVRSIYKIDGVKVTEEERLIYEDNWLHGGRKGKHRADLETDNFFHFKYESGNYYYVSSEEQNDHKIAIIEYYPKSHFSETGRDPIGSRSDLYDPFFDKTSVVTLHISLEEHQIIRIDFENVELDYLPYSWLVHFEEFRASMTMQKTSDGIWLPNQINARAVATEADRKFAISLRRTYHDYKKAGVKVSFEFKGRTRRNKN